MIRVAGVDLDPLVLLVPLLHRLPRDGHVTGGVRFRLAVDVDVRNRERVVGKLVGLVHEQPGIPVHERPVPDPAADTAGKPLHEDHMVRGVEVERPAGPPTERPVPMVRLTPAATARRRPGRAATGARTPGPERRAGRA